jgi:hypothetical protein
MSNKPAEREAQAPATNISGRRRWRIPRTPAPPITESERRDRQARRQRRLWRQAEAARIAEKQFKIRIERAVMLIARKLCDTNVACRAVGLHNSTKAREKVKALCDERGIARRYWWGVPRWKTQAPYPAIVPSRKEKIRAQRRKKPSRRPADSRASNSTGVSG